MDPTSTAIEAAKRRREALVKWEADLAGLQDAAGTFLSSTSAILKQCPLNDTAPLEATFETDESVVSVPEAFHRIFDRLIQTELAEQQIKIARLSLVARRNRMAKVSSVSRLPAELLDLVFRYVVSLKEPGLLVWGTVGDGSEDGLRRRLAQARPEIVLTWVCQVWRDVALNSPHLWQDIDFLKEKPPFNRAQKYLIRSQEAPLDITVNVQNIPHLPYLNKSVYLCSALATALPAFERWNRLRIHGNNALDIRQAFRSMIHSGSPETLKTIRSVWLSHDSMGPGIVLLDEEGNKFWETKVEKLHTLILEGIVLPWTWSRWYGNLTIFKLVFPEKSANTQSPPWGPMQEQLLAVLKRCPALKTLHLEELRFQNAPLNLVPAITSFDGDTVAQLPLLQNLVLHKCHTPSISSIFNMIHAEHLELIEFEIAEPVQNPVLRSTILAFAARYSLAESTIRTFDFGWNPDINVLVSHPDLVIIEILGHLPNLTELKLRGGYAGQPLWDALTPGHNGATPPICQRVVSLYLHAVTFSPAALFDYAEARATHGVAPDNNPRPLQFVYVKKVANIDALLKQHGIADLGRSFRHLQQWVPVVRELQADPAPPNSTAVPTRVWPMYFGAAPPPGAQPIQAYEMMMTEGFLGLDGNESM